MKLFKQAADMQLYLSKLNLEGKKIGFVPTMGALHNGHISLLQMSKHQCDVSVCSIFVNPTQFNDKKDFDNYPITIGADIRLLENSGCDVLYLAQANEVYPDGTDRLQHYDLGILDNILEGGYRPGHFQGVCQVVHRLLDIVLPDCLFLGQKDYQQCMVIKHLIKLIQNPVKVVIGPTLREASGLAMSSRNQRLSQKQKDQATAIYKMLTHIQATNKSLLPEILVNHATDYLLSNGFHKVDYVTIADCDTLKPATDCWPPRAVALIAAFIGEIRLIDNMIIDV